MPPALRDGLMARHGIAANSILDPYSWVKLQTASLLMEEAAEQLTDSCLGARIGLTFRAGHAGPFGALYGTCPTLADVFRNYRRFAPLIQDNTLMSMALDEGVCVLTYRITDAAIPMRRQDTEMSTASIISFIRGFLSPGWAPVEVHFSHAGQGREDTLRRLFGAPVRFGMTENRILIAAADLSRANPLANTALHPFVLRHLEDLLGREERTPSLRHALHEVIARHLGQQELTLAMVARELGFSARTLQRRLTEEGVSFRAVLEEARCAVAERLLRDSSRPIKLIAHHLGYGDLSGFSRACRNWTGHSPRALRK